MDAPVYTKPLPTLTDDNRPFWAACKHGELRMQQCNACRHVRYPINAVCPRCLGGEFEWIRLSGGGSIFSYIVFHQVYSPSFAKDVPYNVALIQLDEGPRMFSNIVGVPNDVPEVGDRVTVTFERATNEISLPKFQLVSSS